MRIVLQTLFQNVQNNHNDEVFYDAPIFQIYGRDCRDLKYKVTFYSYDVIHELMCA